ncbi:amino acid ABC transporter permease [Micrococcales bacterium 31B]|nr:amino acid ABC transporter permease [Micrococcales bacterium 31B]
MSDKWTLVLDALPTLLTGLVQATIPLTALSFALGLALALLVALMRLSRNAVVRGVAATYVAIIRGTPLLVQLFVIFFGLPAIGLYFDPFIAATIGLSLNVGGYASEILRSSIQAVPQGQWESAMSVGMTRTQTLQYIVLPQALKISVPPLSNTLISLLKDTSLASTVLVSELMRNAQEVAAPSQDFFLLYSVAAVVYLVVCLVLSFGQLLLERYLERHTRTPRK